jgi:hypothetical protein
MSLESCPLYFSNVAPKRPVLPVGPVPIAPVAPVTVADIVADIVAHIVNFSSSSIMKACAIRSVLQSLFT